MTVLITGSTDGIGLETATQLARQGKEIVLHGRNEEKAQHARDAVLRSVPDARLHVAHADLADLDQVSRMAVDLAERLATLDVLINNAGVYVAERKLSKHGIEMTLAVNHVAHFLLTLSLLPLLRKAPEPRVVTVSSVAHKSGEINFNDMNRDHHFDAYRAYADSKLADALFSVELARRETWLTSNSLHPGVIDTKLLRAGFSLHGAPLSRGARTSVYLATSPDVKGVTGKYFDDCVVVETAAVVHNRLVAQKLWEWSEHRVRPFLLR